MQLFVMTKVKFLLDNKYSLMGLKKIKLAHAMFSNEGPYLSRPDVTRRPKVTPNKYKANNKKLRVNQV